MGIVGMFRRPIWIRRWGADGRHDFQMRLNVQPLRADELQALPEGLRQTKRLKAWGPSLLTAADQSHAAAGIGCTTVAGGMSACPLSGGITPPWATTKASFAKWTVPSLHRTWSRPRQAPPRLRRKEGLPVTVREAKRHIENITKKYFTGAVVGFSGQSANVKSKSPYVCITPGSPTRDQFPVQRMVNDRMVSYYQTKLPLQIDLYTNGAEGSPGPDGFVTMEDTAVDDMTDFVDYLESPYVIHWCDRINATIVVNGPVQQLTGLVTDTDYQFRAMVELVFCYVHKAVGYTGIQGESSIVYPESRTLQANPEPPIHLEPQKTPGTVPNPVTSPRMMLRTVWRSSLSMSQHPAEAAVKPWSKKLKSATSLRSKSSIKRRNPINEFQPGKNLYG